MFEALKKNDYIRLMSFMKPRMLRYSIAIIGDCAIDAGMNVVIAFVFKYMMDAAVKGDMSLLVKAVVIISAAVLALCMIVPLTYYTYMRCVKQTMADIRLKAFAHIEELPADYFERNHSGDLISRITNDIQTMEQAYSWQTRLVIFTLFFGIGSGIAMFLMNWKIASILVLFGILSAFINTRFAGPLRKISDKLQKLQGTLTERLTDMLAGFNIIKMFHVEGKIIGRYKETNKEIVKAQLMRTRLNALMDSVSYIFNWINFGGIIAVGCFMVLNRSIGFGELLAIVQLLNGVVFMFLQFGKFVGWLQSSLAGASRVYELLDTPLEPESYDVMGAQPGEAVIEMQDISFSYENNKKVLDGLTLKIDKGQVAALVGPSGGGKSTVIKLLLGFYPPDGGCMSLDGKPMGRYPLTGLRDMIAYVPQDAYLFDGTIEENLRYGKSGATIDEIINAAKMANAHEFIMEQADGYKTVVGERGAKLSGGQKQRIAIARALLKNAPVLLLDEATSALDSESERLVQEALNMLMKGRTVIAVAHRLSTIEHADVIYVIDGGKVVEQGTHSDLASGEGLYSRLYELQFQQEAEVAVG